MKKNLFYSFLVLLFIFTGCSQNQVEIDTAEGTVNKDNMEQSTDEQSVVDADATLDQVEGVEETVVEDSAMVTPVAEETVDMTFEPVLFEFDKFSLTPEMLSVARDNAAKVLNTDTPSVKLEGNCDEWGSDEYNYALGLKRAKTVKDILVAEGYNADSISMVSFGESNPVCSEKNEACWKQNRRVEYKVNP